MEFIEVRSPNFSSGRRGYRPEAIVIHIMEGSLSGTDSWFRNPQSKVSAHYGIGLSGEAHRYVEESDTAWHAGRVNAPKWTLIKPAKESGNYVNPNYYTIGIEHEGDAETEWTTAMYESSSQLIAEACKRWGIPIDRLHVIGHREIYSLKSCPGSKASIDKLIEMAVEKAGISVPSALVMKRGTTVTTVDLNLRRGSPSTASPVAKRVPKGTELVYAGYTDRGQKVGDVSKWYRTEDGLWFWGGGVKEENSVDTKTKGNGMPTDCEVIKSRVREVVRQMWFAGTSLTDDEIGKKTMKELHLGFGASLPGVTPAAAFVVKLSGCTDVQIKNLSEAKLKQQQGWTVDNVAAFICAETKIAKGDLP